MAKKSLARPINLPLSSSAPLVTPLIQSNVYVSDDPDTLDRLYEGNREGYTYAREGHPNADVLAKRIDLLEKTSGGLITSSGMAAITAVLLGICQSGDHVIGGDQLYGRTLRLMQNDLPRLGIETTLADSTSSPNIEAAIKPNTRLVLIELMSNPTLRIADLKGISKVCKSRGIILVVDNTFTTPYSVQPLDHGADIVVHSITKMLAGHSDVTLGYMCASSLEFRTKIYEYSVTTGLTASPFECWLAERGLATFDLRFKRCQETAKQLADWLKERPEITKVIYPLNSDHPDRRNSKMILGENGCNIVSFIIDGDRTTANIFTKSADQIPFAPTLGDIGTTLSHPASSSHRSLSPQAQREFGISEGFFRVSVGLESFESLTEIIKKALTDITK